MDNKSNSIASPALPASQGGSTSNGSNDGVEEVNSSSRRERRGFANVENIFNVVDRWSAQEMLASSYQIGEIIPRHLVIDSEQPGRFKDYPKHNLALIIKKFLGIGEKEVDEVPEIFLWTRIHRGTETEVTSINVKTKCDKHSKKLLLAKEIFGVKVIVTPHPSRNLSKGKVWDKEGIFSSYTETQLQEALENYGVAKVERGTYLNSKKERVYGKQYFLTFATASPPTSLNFPQIGIKMDVEKCLPRPIRCFGCQKFGHGKDRCKTKDQVDVCANCGDRHVTSKESPCVNDARCVNCRGAHSAASFTCPAYKQEEYIKHEAVKKEIAPRDVVMQLKSVGQYINYSKPSTAKVVSEGRSSEGIREVDRERKIRKEEENTRLATLENSMGTLMQIVGTLATNIENLVQGRQPQHSRSHGGRDGEEMIIDDDEQIREENAHMRMEINRLRKENEDFQQLKQEFRQMKEDMRKLQSQNTDDGDKGYIQEIAQLKEEIKSLKEEKNTEMEKNDGKSKEVQDNKAKADMLEPLQAEITRLKKEVAAKTNEHSQYIEKTMKKIDKAKITTDSQTTAAAQREAELKKQVEALIAQTEYQSKALKEVEEAHALETAALNDQVKKLKDQASSRYTDRSRTHSRNTPSGASRDRSLLSPHPPRGADPMDT